MEPIFGSADYWKAYVVILSYTYSYICSSNTYWVPIFVVGTILGSGSTTVNETLPFKELSQIHDKSTYLSNFKMQMKQ